MRYSLILLFTSLWFSLSAQSEKPVYFERADDSLVRFYYDMNYFLVDKNCEFKSIERLAEFEAKTTNFIGKFSDYYPNGRKMLEGNYQEGKKAGFFQAFHPNGQVKWTVTYQDNVPVGEWNYFYPDGKPLLQVLYFEGRSKLQSYWDQMGNQRIKEGTGNYDFKVPYPGYNPYGYPFIRYKGRFEDGYPEGVWQIFFENDKKRQIAGQEEYRNGRLVVGEDYYTGEPYKTPKYPLIPVESFIQAESILAKGCTYDDFSGFLVYLRDFFNNSFNTFQVESLPSEDFSIIVQLTKNGAVRKVDLQIELDPNNQELSKALIYVANAVEYYQPSFKNGEYVADEISIHGKAMLTEEGKLNFHSIRIERPAEQN